MQHNRSEKGDFWAHLVLAIAFWRFREGVCATENQAKKRGWQCGKAFWQQSKRNWERPVDLACGFGQVSPHQITGEAYVRF
jgi:hypothetical protein